MLDAHMSSNNCEERAESIYKPEWLTTNQERVLNTRFDTNISDEEKWRIYYRVLYPDDPRGQNIDPSKLSSCGALISC
jgi:hypothetical protein